MKISAEVPDMEKYKGRKRGGSIWIFVQGPRIPSYATATTSCDNLMIIQMGETIRPKHRVRMTEGQFSINNNNYTQTVSNAP